MLDGPAGSIASLDIGRWREVDLRSALLSRAARARAILAVGAASPGRGRRGERGWHGSLASDRAAVLVGVGEDGRGCQWIVRGYPWSIGPRAVTGLAFARAVRARRGAPAGTVLGGKDEGMDRLLCGLCGGVLGCRDKGGLRVGLDYEIALHPLAPSWVAPGGA